jgi:ribose 5-phosphate isomerase B
MRIAVGSDSENNLTREIIKYLEAKGIELLRCGALAGETADYVDAARTVGETVSSGRSDQGLLFCNTGTGVTIVANKLPGVRAALCPDCYSAEIARLANNANVLVLGMRLTGEMHAKEIVDAWLATSPSTEERRVNFHRKTDLVDQEFRASKTSQ